MPNPSDFATYSDRRKYRRREKTLNGRHSQANPESGHELWHAQITRVKDNGQYDAAVISGSGDGFDFTGQICPSLSVSDPDVTFAIGDYVSIRVAAYESPIIISGSGGGGSGTSTLERHSHSGPDDGGYIAFYAGSY